MTDNVVDFTSRLKEKLEKLDLEDDASSSRYLEDDDKVHEICTETANEMINNLEEDYGFDTSKIEHSAEMIFFFEAYKALLMKCVDQWHPFQDMAEQFMIEQKITIEEDENGYRYILSEEISDEPANDE